MPLYMDFHKIPNITVEEAQKAHMADEQIQQKYGVTYLKFWCNQQAGNLFCLVEGPDQKTCEDVHRMAHGHLACALVEVDPGLLATIMGENIKIDQGLVRRTDGSVDLGYRSILAVTLLGKPGPSAKSANFDPLPPVKIKGFVLSIVAKHHGRAIKLRGDDTLLSAFDSAPQALKCATEIQDHFQKANKKKVNGGSRISCTIGLGAGQPVTENNEFIEEAIRLAERLNQVAPEGSILLSSLVEELCELDVPKRRGTKLKALKPGEEAFMADLFRILDERLADDALSVESLVQAMGISRPQLYRKVRELSGKAPNDFIRDLRLDKSLSLLKRKSGNISEVAFEVGFNNPSYFAKCFARKFGCQPSRFAALSA